MKIRLSLTFEVTRARKTEDGSEPHETFESQGSLIETAPQPRYVGFEAIE